LKPRIRAHARHQLPLAYVVHFQTDMMAEAMREEGDTCSSLENLFFGPVMQNPEVHQAVNGDLMR
jgi:hypothetical protein